MPRMTQAIVGRRRVAAPEVRREQILDAAAAALVERGFAALTMADVAARAALAKGTLYLYFASKEDLVAALYVRYNRTLVTEARSLLRSGGGYLERIRRVLAAAFDYHRANLALHHVLLHEAGMREDVALRELEELLAAFIAEGRADGVFDVADAEVTARFVVYGLHGLLVDALHARRPNRAAFVRDGEAIISRLLSPRD